MKRTNQFIVFQHRDHHVRPNAAKFDGSNYPRIASFNVASFFSKIGCVDDIFVCHRSAHGVFGTKAYPLMPSQFEKGNWRVISCDVVQKLTIPSEDVAKACIADANRFLQHSGEYRLQLHQRTRDLSATARSRWQSRPGHQSSAQVRFACR